MDLPLDTNLKAGLNVSGTLSLSKRKALILPASAVQHASGTARVFKVNADSKVEAVDVKIGRIQDAQEEITSRLEAHIQVVAIDVESLRSGEQVSLVNPEGGQKVHPHNLALCH